MATVVAALGGRLSVRILYQGVGLDRLRDRAHARVVEAVVRDLLANGWQVATEVSFNVFGDRGVIDILAFHPPTGALLVVEATTVVPDVGGMLANLDRKVRIAPGIARRRGWPVRSVSRLLVMRDTATARRRVAEHASIFEVAFPTRTVGVRRWLQAPPGAWTAFDPCQMQLPPAIEHPRAGGRRPGPDVRARTTRTTRPDAADRRS